jgi:hypothetical protein
MQISLMTCPHCTVDFHASEQKNFLGKDFDADWGVGVTYCSACLRIIVRLFSGNYDARSNQWSSESSSRIVRPKTTARAPLSPDVPEVYAADYREACNVLADSSKASAALSRRCLQHLLREEMKTTKKDLVDQIQEVLDSARLPSHIAESLDSVRSTGNFAAHPIKNKASGEIVDVEPGEADWNLETLEQLFDFLLSVLRERKPGVKLLTRNSRTRANRL